MVKLFSPPSISKINYAMDANFLENADPEMFTSKLKEPTKFGYAPTISEVV